VSCLVSTRHNPKHAACFIDRRLCARPGPARPTTTNNQPARNSNNQPTEKTIKIIEMTTFDSRAAGLGRQFLSPFPRYTRESPGKPDMIHLFLSTTEK
jgi:hypothetical protein